jgi:hypothetical protein
MAPLMEVEKYMEDEVTPASVHILSQKGRVREEQLRMNRLKTEEMGSLLKYVIPVQAVEALRFARG